MARRSWFENDASLPFGASVTRLDSWRDAIASIAGEELDHALLSWDVHEWALKELDARDRKRIDRAMQVGVFDLERATHAQTDTPWQHLLGEPNAEVSADALKTLAPLWGLDLAT